MSASVEEWLQKREIKSQNLPGLVMEWIDDILSGLNPYSKLHSLLTRLKQYAKNNLDELLSATDSAVVKPCPLNYDESNLYSFVLVLIVALETELNNYQNSKHVESFKNLLEFVTAVGSWGDESTSFTQIPNTSVPIA
jgi:hypothetical protein